MGSQPNDDWDALRSRRGGAREIDRNAEAATAVSAVSAAAAEAGWMGMGCKMPPPPPDAGQTGLFEDGNEGKFLT